MQHQCNKKGESNLLIQQYCLLRYLEVDYFQEPLAQVGVHNETEDYLPFQRRKLHLLDY